MRPTSDPFPPSSTVRVGRLAETLAAGYLELIGFRLLDRNVRLGPREIDLVAEHDGWLIMVEVRFRRSLERGLPEETIHPGKRRHLMRAGMTYWLRHGRDRGRLRFDLVTIGLVPEGLRLRHHRHFLVPGRSRF